MTDKHHTFILPRKLMYNTWHAMMRQCIMYDRCGALCQPYAHLEQCWCPEHRMSPETLRMALLFR